MNRIRARERWLLAGACLLFIALHAAYVLQVGADVAYMDTLRYIGYYPDVAAHPARAFAYWNQGEHRGLLTQLALWANIRLLGMDILLANVMTGFVLAGIATLVAWRWIRASAAQGGWRPWAIAGFVFPLVFSPAAFELHTLDIGLAEIGRNLLYLSLAVPLLDARRPPRRGAAVALAALVVASMLFASYGRIYAFALALVATATLAARARAGRGDPDAAKTAWLACGAVTVGFVAFCAMSSMVPSSVGAGHPLVHSPWVAMRGAGQAAASALVGVDAALRAGLAPWFLAATGGVLGAATLAASARYVRELRNGAPALPLFMALYGGLNALAIGAARGDGGIQVAMSSRYYPDLSLALAGLAWMLATLRPAAPGAAARRAWGAILLALGGAWAAGLAATTVQEAQALPYRTKAFDEMRAAALSCVPLTQAEADLLQANTLDIAQSAVDYQRQHRLGPWRDTATACD